MKKIYKILWWGVSIFLGLYLTALLFVLFFVDATNHLTAIRAIPVYDMYAPSEEKKTIGNNFVLEEVAQKEKVNLAEVQNQVVFLNFWATWCKPCIAEMPSILKLKNKFKNESIKFIIASEEEVEKIVKFEAQRKIGLPFFSYDFETLPPAFWGESLPRTYIMVNGEILYAHTGSADWFDAEVVKQIEDYLKERG